MERQPANDRNLDRLDRLMALLLQQGVLDQWVAWWHEQRNKPDYDGLSGMQIMDWLRHNHPELVTQAERIIRS